MGCWVRVCVLLSIGGLLACASTPAPAPAASPVVAARPLAPRQARLSLPAPALPPEPPPAPPPTVTALTPASAVSVEPAAIEPPPLAVEPRAAEPVAPVAAEPATPMPVVYTGGEPCKRALTGSSPVAEACRREGLPGAKAVMKQMVRDGWAAGLALTCDDCHVDRDDHAKLTPDASQRFTQLLTAFTTR
jgi:hypothetical protein